MTKKKLLIIGISGVTCGGKTTLACKLTEIVPNSTLISQDDYFLADDDPRHTWIPELDHVNYDILSSLDMEKMEDDIGEVMKKYRLINVSETDQKQKFNIDIDMKDQEKDIYEQLQNSDIHILIVEGFCIFNYKPLRDIYHLKYYFTLPKEDCCHRRNQRVYEPPDCPGYFEQCVWPEHLKQLKEVKNEMEGVRYFDGNSTSVLEEVLRDIKFLVNVNQNT